MSKKLRLLVSVALLTWLAWRTDWAQLGRAFTQLHLELWLAAVGLYLLTQVISALRWQLLAEPLGFHQSLPQYIRFYFIGMFFNLLLPTSVGGDVVRGWYLDSGTGRRVLAFLSVIADRFSGLVVLILLACAAVLFCPITLPPWVPVCVWATAACAFLGLVTLLVAAQYSGGQECLSAGWQVPRRAAALARSLSNSLTLFAVQPRLLLATTGLSLLVQAANVILVWLVGQAIDAPVPASYYWILVPMVTLLTLLPISLNGMGVREGGTVLFLAPLGVSQATALSLALLWFSVFAAASLCGAGVFLFGRYSQSEEPVTDGYLGGDSDQGRTGQPKAAA